MLSETIGTKKCTMCGEAKSLSSFRKQKATKDGLAYWCKACASLWHKKYRQDNQDKISQRKKKHYQGNRDKILQRCKKYYEDNRDKVLQRNKRWTEKNQDKIFRWKGEWNHSNRDRIAQRKREWRQNNASRVNASVAHRRAAKRNATPPWADQTAINAIYAEARWLQEFTGEPYHVDHIVPLNSDFVCGLHVPANLQALPSVENLAKNNHSWPGQLPSQTRRGIDHQWWNDLQQKLSGMTDRNV
jgi:hypothetical protein